MPALSETPNPRRACPTCRLVRAASWTLRDAELTKREQSDVERIIAVFAPDMDERQFCRDCQALADAPAEANRPTRCEHCGNLFAAVRSTARFCSTRCRVAHHREQHAQTA